MYAFCRDDIVDMHSQKVARDKKFQLYDDNGAFVKEVGGSTICTNAIKDYKNGVRCRYTNVFAYANGAVVYKNLSVVPESYTEHNATADFRRDNSVVGSVYGDTSLAIEIRDDKYRNSGRYVYTCINGTYMMPIHVYGDIQGRRDFNYMGNVPSRDVCIEFPGGKKELYEVDADFQLQYKYRVYSNRIECGMGIFITTNGSCGRLVDICKATFMQQGMICNGKKFRLFTGVDITKAQYSDKYSRIFS